MTHWLDPDRENALIADFEKLLEKEGLSGRFNNVRAILKDGKDSLVALGQFEGTAAVFKAYRLEDRQTIVENSVGALSQYQARLQGTNSAVVRVLASAPASGLLVMEEAKGTRVSRLLERVDVDQSECIRRAARWLINCAGTETVERRFFPNKWLRPFEEHIRRHGALRAECADLLQSLKSQRPALRGSSLVWGPTHGDYKPVNLADDGCCLTAYDVQGVPTLPLIKVGAHFLVARDFQRAITQPLRWGLDVQTTHDFVQELRREIAIDISAIRFSVGHAMLWALLFDSFEGKRRANALLRVQNYLEDSRD